MEDQPFVQAIKYPFAYGSLNQCNERADMLGRNSVKAEVDATIFPYKVIVCGWPDEKVNKEIQKLTDGWKEAYVSPEDLITEYRTVLKRILTCVNDRNLIQYIQNALDIDKLIALISFCLLFCGQFISRFCVSCCLP